MARIFTLIGILIVVAFVSQWKSSTAVVQSVGTLTTKSDLSPESSVSTTVTETVQAEGKVAQKIDALETIRTGTISRVLAVLPEIAKGTDEFVQEAVALQGSLCRFKNDPSSNELGFEVVKYKFSLLLGKSKALKPWTTVCSG